MSQREDLIRGPASVALEGLCAVGKADDEDSGDLGPMTLSSELVGQYEAFKCELATRVVCLGLRRRR